MRRDIIIMIEPDVYLDENMTATETIAAEKQRKESIRARKLVMAHLKKLDYSSLWIVKDLDQMLDLSLTLHASLVLRKVARNKYT